MSLRVASSAALPCAATESFPQGRPHFAHSSSYVRLNRGGFTRGVYTQRTYRNLLKLVEVVDDGESVMEVME